MKFFQDAQQLLQISVFFLLGITNVFGIRCFQCNSNNNSACTNLELVANNPLHPTPCVGNFDGKEPFCRKIVIGIVDRAKDVQHRTIRGCGWIPYKAPCYNADNEDHSERVCQCFEDGCNGATVNGVSSISALLLPALLVAKIYCDI